MPRRKTLSSPEAEQFARDVESYPRAFPDLLKFLMDKHSWSIESAADKMSISSRNLNRLRSPGYKPELEEIRTICKTLKFNIIDGLQLLHSGGFDPASADAEIMEIILICSTNT